MKLKTVYLILCVLGAALPLWQIAPWLAANGLDVALPVFPVLPERVSAFFGMDVIVSAVVLAVFVFVEGKRVRVRLRWLAIVATLAVGVSLGLPLFLYMRERELESRAVEG